MELISPIYKIKKTKIYTKEMELADRIYSYFNKKLSFSLIMRQIKTKGYNFVSEVLSDIKQSKPKDEVSLFMWKIGQTKINLIEKPTS